jgi:RNA helicase
VVHYYSLNKIKMDHPDKPEANKDSQNMWIYGDTGTGKSRALYMKLPCAYRKNCSKWWDGYTGQKIVIIEDINPSHKHMVQDMKLWLDHYPFVAQSKGSSSVIPPERTYI